MTPAFSTTFLGVENKHGALTRTVPVIANSCWYWVLALHVIYNINKNGRK